MRLRLPSIVLVAWYALLGGGVVAHLHDLDHDREDAAEHRAGHPPHDESNCPVHAQLHFAFTFDGAAVPPTAVRAWVPARPVPVIFRPPAPVPSRCRCRDPPVG